MSNCTPAPGVFKRLATVLLIIAAITTYVIATTRYTTSLMLYVQGRNGSYNMMHWYDKPDFTSFSYSDALVAYIAGFGFMLSAHMVIWLIVSLIIGIRNLIKYIVCGPAPTVESAADEPEIESDTTEQPAES